MVNVVGVVVIVVSLYIVVVDVIVIIVVAINYVIVIGIDGVVLLLFLVMIQDLRLWQKLSDYLSLLQQS